MAPSFLSLCRGGRLAAETELLEHPERVPVAPGLDDLAVVDPVDAYTTDLAALAGAGHSHQVTIVGAPGNPASNDFVALGNLVLDGDLQVREGRSIHRDHLLEAFASFLAEGVVGVVVDSVGGHDVIQLGRVGAVENIEHGAGNRLVLVGHGVLSGGGGSSLGVRRPPARVKQRQCALMATVSSLDLPRLEYLDPELRGDRFHEVMLSLADE